MISKEEYKNGLRCERICIPCRQKELCYQYNPIDNNPSTIDKLKAELKSKDVKIQWLEKMVEYYIQFKPIDSESFKREFDYKWIGENENDR